MKDYVIVGGGISGLLAAHQLKKRGISFIGIESSDALGGRAKVGHHRLYEPENVKLLSDEFRLSLQEFVDPPREKSKGEWSAVEGEWSEEEKFYLSAPFYEATDGFSAWIAKLAEEVKENFRMRREVTRIDPAAKKVFCQDGAEIEYEKLIWCGRLEQLNKVWKGDALQLAKVMQKKKESEEEKGGINLDLKLKAPLFDQKNTVVFPFRFKDHKLRALGTTTEHLGEHWAHWMLFLNSDIAEDHEEVAKCVRTLKRELEKEFVGMRENCLSERIVFLPKISGENPGLSSSLELLPDVLYVGPQMRLEEDKDTLRNIDLILANYAKLPRYVPRDSMTQ